MMRIGDIGDSIIREAKDKAKHIISEAKDESERRIKQAKKELNRKRMQEIDEYESELNKMINEMVSSAELKAKKGLQTEKEKVANSIMDKAFSKLKSLRRSKSKYSKVIANLYKKGVRELGGDTFEIICNKDDAKVVKSVAGKKDSVKIDNSIAGGIIIKRKDINVLIDLTFSTLLKDKEDAAKIYIYRKLFK